MNKLLVLNNLKEEYKDCDKCKLKELRTKVVFGSGTENPRILVIAEAPGSNEDKYGEPLIGITGMILDYILARESGIPILLEYTKTFDIARVKWPDHKNCKAYLKQFIYYDNVCMCFPNRKEENSKKPERDEIKACSDRLKQVIYTLDPTIILSVGGVSLSALKGKTSTILKERGKLFDIYLEGKSGVEIPYSVLPIIHPSYLARNNNTATRNKKDGPWQNTFNDIKYMYQLLNSYDSL